MKKLLVITYYWPPAGGPGVQRWLKFVKYLGDFNIAPIVYIPENPEYPMLDTSFQQDIPEGITIYKQPIFEPYRFAGMVSSKKTKRISSGIIATKNQSFIEKTLLWIRGNFFIPDARKYWVKPSVNFLTGIISKEGIDTIITTGPPHSVHLIGHQLKKNLKVKWLADFRDPWTSIGYHKKLKLSKASEKKHKALESMVLNNADRIIVTSETTKEEFKRITKQPITVITNGYDTEKQTSVTLDSEFTISHIGSLLTGRNPENLWQVLKELLAENEAFKKTLKLQFIGVVSTAVLESIYNYSLEPYVELVGYVSHEKAIKYQYASQILLLAEINSEETKGIIPGKLFEYINAKRPILGVGPIGWDVATIIKETNAGVVFNYNSHNDLKNVLLSWFKDYQEKDLKVASTNIEKYSRRELTKKLSEYI